MISILSTFSVFIALSGSSAFGKPLASDSVVTSVSIVNSTPTTVTSVYASPTTQVNNGIGVHTTTAQPNACATTTVLGYSNNAITTVYGGDVTYTAYPTTVVVNGTGVVAQPTTVVVNGISVVYPTSTIVADATTILSTVYPSGTAAATTIFPNATSVVTSYFPGGTSTITTIAPSGPISVVSPSTTGYPDCTVTVTALSPSGTAVANGTTGNGIALAAEGKNGAEAIFSGKLVGAFMLGLGSIGFIFL